MEANYLGISHGIVNMSSCVSSELKPNTSNLNSWRVGDSEPGIVYLRLLGQSDG